MFNFFSYYFFGLVVLLESIKIPFIDNVILQSSYMTNNTLFMNGTCHQCLCNSSLSYAALNCFLNYTCQLFPIFPLTYSIKAAPGSRLYFPRQSFPNVSQCCMSNINDLLSKLNTINLTSMSMGYPREIIIDNNGYLATVNMKSNYISQFYINNLTEINRIVLPIITRTISYNNGAYYVASNNGSIVVVDSQTLIIVANISTMNINGARGIIFLNSGQMMIISSINSNTLIFFNRSNISPINYVFAFYQSVNYSSPHGMWYVNDSFFYVTSYTNNAIYSYTATNIYSLWQEQLVFSIPKNNNSTGLTHLTVDSCSRIWLSSETDTALVYDQQGNLLGNLTIPNSKIFDIKIMNNYLMYFSDTSSNRTIRLDPQSQC